MPFMPSSFRRRMFAQRRQAPADEAADRADPAAQGGADLVVGQVMEVPQDERGPLSLGQLAQHRPQLVPVVELGRAVAVGRSGRNSTVSSRRDGPPGVVDEAVGQAAPHVGERQLGAGDELPFGYSRTRVSCTSSSAAMPSPVSR